MTESDRTARVVPVSYTEASTATSQRAAAPLASAYPSPSELSSAGGEEAPAKTPEKPDLRAASRYPFSATADVFEPQSRTRISGRASDLGVGGCYIDTVTTFPVGTSVRLRLTHDGTALHAAAAVTYMAHGMGMGLAFTRMSPEHANLLSSWLANLRGEGEVLAEPDWEAESKPPQSQPPSAVDPPAGLSDLLRLSEAVRDLAELLADKRILSEIESLRLRQKLSR